MPVLVSVDCGLHGLGSAIFYDQELLCADYLGGRGGQAHPLLEPLHYLGEFLEPVRDRGIDLLVVEIPQIYPGPNQKGRQSDLVKLALVAGEVILETVKIHGCRSVLPIEPAKWKRQVDPDVLIERIKGRLSVDEAECVDYPSKPVEHNVWDAVGIGLWKLGRL